MREREYGKKTGGKQERKESLKDGKRIEWIWKRKEMWKGKKNV